MGQAAVREQLPDSCCPVSDLLHHTPNQSFQTAAQLTDMSDILYAAAGAGIRAAKLAMRTNRQAATEADLEAEKKLSNKVLTFGRLCINHVLHTGLKAMHARRPDQYALFVWHSKQAFNASRKSYACNASSSLPYVERPRGCAPVGFAEPGPDPCLEPTKLLLPSGSFACVARAVFSTCRNYPGSAVTLS